MPHNSRGRIREQAKIMRETGESVVLLISNKSTSSRATPLSITVADAPEALTADTKKTIYARVSWSPNEAVSYDEGGRVRNLKAEIEANICYKAAMQSCYGVQFSDGTILRKTSEKLSEGRVSYTITVAGAAKVVE